VHLTGTELNRHAAPQPLVFAKITKRCRAKVVIGLSVRHRLFKHKDAYDHPGTDALFAKALSDVVAFHALNCSDYAAILQREGYDASKPVSINEIQNIPPIPTLFLKQHQLLSMPLESMLLQSTTSGTSGTPVTVGMDRGCVRLGLSMMVRLLRHHRLISMLPTRHVILGYQPAPHNHMGAVKTAYASTWLALPASRIFALRDTGKDYELDIEGICDALERYSRARMPVRITGFPSFLLALIQYMEGHELHLKMPPGSKVMLGGGWKHTMAKPIEKTELFRMVNTTFGLNEQDIIELFAVVEHPIPYFCCTRHHFHVPVYSRVIIRNPQTLDPMPFGQPGLLNLLTPFLLSMPLSSIMTDDVAVLYPGTSCGCGLEAPWFEILGRAGVEGIQTCAVKAEEML